MWPHVARAAAYLDGLRQERRTPEFEAPGRRLFYGILPPSISHEGYSAKPMHSYWDDFFALRGFRDAAELARAIGRASAHDSLVAIAHEFGGDLAASVDSALARHRIDFVPGCADLGDFDATSTTVALSPTGAASLLPPRALARTFERYVEFFDTRRREPSWDAFTPYEMRSIGAMVRLGWRERADSLVRFFLSHRRPAAWNEWAEVVWREERLPRFIGDMPHTWVGSDFIRSVLDMFAYEREEDDALVLGAGLPASWLEGGPGVRVRGLSTHFGTLSYELKPLPTGLEVRIASGVRVPRGGIALQLPDLRPGARIVSAARNERVPADGTPVVRQLPVDLVIER
jgi:hypothetical protein